MVFYRRTYTLGRENIPEDGTPILMVGNHQNSLIDPLATMVNLIPRKMAVFVRADVFERSPVFFKILRWFGALPAYRATVNGEDSLEKNKHWFEIGGDEIMNGRTCLIYPEGTHMDKYSLSDFSLQYLTIAFEAARRHNWKELYIQPMIHHQQEYLGARNSILLAYGEPVSLKPYYELYQEKPRTAQRKVNQIVRERLTNMMLDIKDTPNYRSIFYICKTSAWRECIGRGVSVEHLPTVLPLEREMNNLLAAAGEKDPQGTQLLYEMADEIIDGENTLKVCDVDFEKNIGYLHLAVYALLMLLGLPLFICALWPYWMVWAVPTYAVIRRSPDMMESSLLLGASLLITIPITYAISAIVCALVSHSWLVTLSYVFVILPALGIFAANYQKWYKRLVEKFHYCFPADKKLKARVAALRLILQERVAKMKK